MFIGYYSKVLMYMAMKTFNLYLYLIYSLVSLGYFFLHLFSMKCHANIFEVFHLFVGSYSKVSMQGWLHIVVKTQTASLKILGHRRRVCGFLNNGGGGGALLKLIVIVGFGNETVTLNLNLILFLVWLIIHLWPASRKNVTLTLCSSMCLLKMTQWMLMDVNGTQMLE